MAGWDVEWWHWLLLGFVLLAGELLTPGGLFLVFFGAGALAVGLLSALGIAGPLTVQIALFALLSVVALLTMRHLVLARLRLGDPGAQVDNIVGETALAVEDIPAGGIGKAELRGTVWQARNGGDAVITRGQRCTVVRIEGLTLWVWGEP